MAANPTELAALLYRALASPLGIVATCSDSQIAIVNLGRIRRELNDPALAVLSLRRQTETEVWLVRRGAVASTATADEVIAELFNEQQE